MQRAFIVGTRIGVDNIYIAHELQGQSPDEIVDAYPHLTLANVHAALSYYYEHADEIRNQVRESREFAEQMEAQSKPSKYSDLRDETFGVKDGGENPVSS